MYCLGSLQEEQWPGSVLPVCSLLDVKSVLVFLCSFSVFMYNH